MAGVAATVASPVEAVSENVVAGAKATVETVSQNVVAGAKAMGRSALDVTIFVLIGLVGYVFVMLGVAWLLATHLEMFATLFILGGAHVAVGTIGVVVLVRRPPSSPSLLQTSVDVQRPLDLAKGETR